MKTKPNSIVSDLEPVRRQLEGWRRMRRPKERIPEAIWSALTKLARMHGVSRVARRLGVDYYGLRDRAQATQAPLGPPEAFVEIPVSPPSAPTACVVELEDRSGLKMTLRLASTNPTDTLALMEAFWRRRV